MNLELRGADIFTVIALPLKIVDGDGSPIRAIAIID
jgi:kynurenine formamidase